MRGRVDDYGGSMLPFHRKLWEKVLSPPVPGCLENVGFGAFYRQL